MSVRIQLRRDTAANWTSTNPTLTQGEPGYETDTGKIKYGDGSTAWTSLAYASGGLPAAFAAGTAAAPGFAVDGDSNTGIYSPGADQLALSTNSSERLRIGANGEIGLGGANYGTSGQVLTSAGSGAAPTWQTPAAGAGDKIEEGNTSAEVIDTGSDGRFVVTTEGTERLRVTDTGLVGIGSSAPNCQLTNTGTTSLGTNAWPTSAIGRSNGRAIVGNEGQLILWNETVGAGNSGQLYIGTKSGSNSTDLGYARISAGTENASNLASFFKLETMNSSGTLGTGLYLDSSQRVGIGSTAPTAKLQVVDGSNAALYIGNADAGPQYNNYYLSAQHIFRSGAGTDYGRFDASGRLLVGTSSARTFLSWDTPQVQIEGTGYQQSSLSLYNNENTVNGAVLALGHSRGTSLGSNTVVSNGDYFGAIPFYGSDGSNELRGAEIAAYVDGTPGTNDMPGRLVFSTTADGASSPTERVRIDSSGRLGVGTASPTQDISIGGLGSTGGTFKGLAFQSGSTEVGYVRGLVQDGNNYALSFGTYSGGLSERMRINSIGELHVFMTGGSGIQSKSSAAASTANSIYAGYHSATGITNGSISYVVYTNGNVQNTNNSYAGLSDIKLKENIVDASSQWDDIKALRPVNYNFKPETGHQTHTQIGLVAQEVELVSPGLVTESPDRDADGNDLGTVTKSVNYSVLYMKAVKALQEAMERIEQLEAKMAEVKAQLA